MDASDIIRKLQSQAIYGHYKDKIAKTQPRVNLSTCGMVSTVRITYPDYSQRDLVALGKYYCNSCSTTTSITPIQNTGNGSRFVFERYDKPIM
jgi:hypothetical protein